MIRNPYQLYRANTVETASPVELVAMLYQGVIRFTQRAMHGIERHDIAKAHDNFLRAQAIIVELRSYLDHEAGGDVAQRLAALYDYSYRRLLDANCQKDVAPAEEVISLFRELHGAWQTIAEAKGRESVESNLPAPARLAV